MTREIVVGAAQLGPVSRDDTRAEVVERLLTLLRRGAEHGCELVVFPELALTTFFPRWFLDEGDEAGIAGDTTELDSYYETAMPNAVVQPLFDEAKRLKVGFHLGYAELTDPNDPKGDGTQHRYNTAILVDREGEIVGRYRKVHIPGHENYEPWRNFQHLERRYFEESPEGFHVHEAFDGIFGMAICNDRRWPETYRVMGLQGVEMVLIGYNTPLNYAPDPSSCKRARTRTAHGSSASPKVGSKKVSSPWLRPRSSRHLAKSWRRRRRSAMSWSRRGATLTCASATRRPCLTSTVIGDPRLTA
jgi:predicted amidohydrolase